MERIKEVGILNKESKSLSCILGEMKQELDVLTASVNDDTTNDDIPASFRQRGENTLQ